MTDCIFCKIVAGELPSTSVWEDDDYYAFFDIFPNCKGQTLVIPKKHYDSQLFEMSDDAYSDLLVAAKKVANLLKKSFEVQRVWMIMEWMWVDHVHIKLYPMHWLNDTWKPIKEAKTQFFYEYPGYLTTKAWDMLSQEALLELKNTLKK